MGSASGLVSVEWVTADGSLLRARIGSCATVAFEAARPVRRFPSYRGQRHFPGLWWSATNDGHVGYESWLERDHVMLLDFDPAVVALASQPLRFEFEIDGRGLSHIPDYFARLDDGRAVVVDVRPAGRIGPNDAVKFSAAAAACAQVEGWSFRLVHEIDPVLTANVRWIAAYRHPRHAQARWSAPLLEAFTEPRALIVGVEQVGDPIAVLPVCYHLVWRGVLQMDLAHAPLSDATAVWSHGGHR